MWDLMLRYKEGTRASKTKIRRLMRLTRVMTAFHETPPTIVVKHKPVMTKYKKLKKEASQLRVQFGKRIIKARAKERKTTEEVQEKQLKQAFGQRALAR